jgi:inhibitor of cysteine peptidase
MKHLHFTAKASLLSIAFVSIAPLQAGAFGDVRQGITPYSTAIQHLKEQGVIEGYKDGSFKPTARINRAEFLKIIIESKKEEVAGKNCFPDVTNEWFAAYVCTAQATGIIDGYPDGTFRPERSINFAEASKILSLAYGQDIQDHSPDWYEPFVRALENSKAIPLSVENLEQDISRGEMAEMMWRLTEEKTDQPSKGYLNVKYPEVMVNMASDSPQRASSCADLKAFTEESNRGFYGDFGIMEDAIAMPMATTRAFSNSVSAEAGSAQKSYSETNVQVEGVDESDIVKTDGTYVYAVLEGKVRIVRADPPESMELVSTIDLLEEEFNPTEMYIENDRLVLLGTSWQSFNSARPAANTKMRSLVAPAFYGGQKTEVRMYDVSDRTSPLLERTVSFDGNTISTRKIGSTLYLVMNEGVRWHVPNPIPVPLETDLMPKFQDSLISESPMPVARCGDVVILPHIPNPQYLIVAAIPTDTVTKEIQREVVLGSAENIYASTENLYIAANQWHYSWRGPIGQSSQETSIYRFAFTDTGIEMKAHGTVPGRILNQFSMDEHEGHFRIATTKGQSWNEGNPSTNNLYILNLNLERIGEVEDMAPGETIYSARFMGDRAYMVTFKKVDPFFVLDVSDPTNPTILGKLKIPGYSDYLHPYDENHIIGFGKDAEEAKEGDFAWYQGMKMALFDVTDPVNPKQLHTFGIGDRGTDSPLLRNHKALLFDKERGLLAFPIQVNKLTEEQKSGPPGSAWGQAVFQGSYVFDFSLEKGFKLKGTISHYDQQDYLKAGSYFYGKNIERILRVEDSLVTISQYGVQAHNEADVNLLADVPFEKVVDTTENCPTDDEASYVSKDPTTCSTIRFSCAEDSKAFSNECGCGCL